MKRRNILMIVVGVFIVALFIVAYFYFPKKQIDLPTEGLASREKIDDRQPATVAATTTQTEVVSIKDRTLAKDGFTIIVPAGWVEVDYMVGTTIIANSGEENFDSVLKKSGFKSYFSVTRERMGEKTWEQAVAYVRKIVDAAAPGVEYVSEREGELAGSVAHFWEAELLRDGAEFKVLVYAVRGAGDDLWILTFNTGTDMWPVYSRLALRVFGSLQLL